MSTKNQVSLAHGVSRSDVEFPSANLLLRGWLYRPAGCVSNSYPAIVMCGGYGTIKEMYTDLYAERFAAAGYMVLLYDHRNFGASDGLPRHEINPWEQIEDGKHALTYLLSLPEVDANRVGIWGSSYSGGHALVIAASDRRVKCVAVQVPTINGSIAARRRVYGEAEEGLLQRFADERQARMQGRAPTMVALFGNADSGAVYRSAEAIAWYEAAYQRTTGELPQVTLSSLEYSRSYNPGDAIAMISPTPLLMIVAEKDYVTPTDLALEAYQRALEPKALQILSACGHFDPYVHAFELSSDAALNWFKQHIPA